DDRPADVTTPPALGPAFFSAVVLGGADDVRLDRAPVLQPASTGHLLTRKTERTGDRLAGNHAAKAVVVRRVSTGRPGRSLLSRGPLRAGRSPAGPCSPRAPCEPGRPCWPA